MQSHIISLHASSPPSGVKRSKPVFHERSHESYQIKGNEHRAPYKRIFCPYTYP